ncbi:arf-GAP domain and FG repeat-containing protein 1 isoform X2 [Lethenteron reissneri]|uniref:arf-GAP domain and FG repeat-containing protein 1 isoform X2 n=1 Tax=Lethenteron reissneri TaxID=7753 RepID=UPI002AB7CD7E|nr:arf-GAP domain and FG repeat-containing protein 1 isoform X2 [Lethenteron reissneri]
MATGSSISNNNKNTNKKKEEEEKKEDEHLRLLREMSSLLHNRRCFECAQRGPTYVDVSLGTFVCTACSGLLRGLNPPHRVKSITMTTFTDQELDFLHKHGNEVCRIIWLGLYDERSSLAPDFKDPQKAKEFLQEKYEKKKWFVAPEQARTVAALHASLSGSSASSGSSTPEVRPLRCAGPAGSSTPTLDGLRHTPTQSPVVSRPQALPPAHSRRPAPFELTEDLPGDPFGTSTQPPPPPPPPPGSAFPGFPSVAAGSGGSNFANFDSFGGSGSSGSYAPFPKSGHPVRAQSTGGATSGSAFANFADFDNFPKSSSADFGSALGGGGGGGAAARPGTGGEVPPADKYAALADLDSMFSAGKQPSPAAVGGHVTTYVLSGPADQRFVDQRGAYAPHGSPVTANATASSAPPGCAYGAGVAALGPVPAQGVAGFAAGSSNPFLPAAPAAAIVGSSNPFQTQANGFAYGGVPAAAPTAAAATPAVVPAGFGVPVGYGGAGSGGQAAHGGVQYSQHAALYVQPAAYGGQHGESAYAAVYAQPKVMAAQFGQSTRILPTNPFLSGATSGTFPSTSVSNNPFL